MKKVMKVILTIVIILIVIIGIGITYFNSRFPINIKAEDLKIEATPERLQRGEYLAQNVSMCIDCHSERDWSHYAGPIIDGTWGKGGEKFDKELVGLPGTIYARNITPAGIKHYTDGELFKVLTTGITNDGRALFPLMPYEHFREMAREDIYSIITYIRSLKPIENVVPDRSLDFPMNFIVKTIPREAAVVDAIPSKSDSVAYGKYMVNAAGCQDCHSQMEKGQYIEGLEFAGGFNFHFPNGDLIVSANITPDMETGIGALTKENFIAKFKAFNGAMIPVKEHEKTTVMPWTMLARMTEEDLGAIYTYLRTVKPVKNKVVTFRPAKVSL